MRRSNHHNVEPRTIVPLAVAVASSGVALYQRQKRRAAERRAEEDAKTGLMDYPPFKEEVAKRTRGTKRSTETGRTHALAFLEIDDFKALNTRFGNPGTDRVALMPVVSAIRSNTRADSDLASRFGGDEFVLFLSDIDDMNARRICRNLQGDINSIRPDIDLPEECLGATIAYTVFEQGAGVDDIERLTGELSLEVMAAKQIPGKNQLVALGDLGTHPRA